MSASVRADAKRASVEARDALIAAVESLTAPKTVANWQGKKLTHRNDPPLLDVLRTAIGSNLGMGGGGGKLGFERSSIDPVAFALYEEIDGRVRSWLGELDAKVGKDVGPAQMLRSWLTLWNATHHEPADHDRRRRIIDSWSTRIDAIIDPPRRVEIGESGKPVPCPACGEDYVLTGHTGSDGEVDLDEAAWARALAVYERGRLEDSYAACGACGARWDGEPGMRWLRILIDEAEAATRSATPATDSAVVEIVADTSGVTRRGDRDDVSPEAVVQDLGDASTEGNLS